MKLLTPQQQAKRIQLINHYFTAFSIVLVGLGVALSQPTAPLAYSCVGLLAFTCTFNEVTARFAHSHPHLGTVLSNLRLTVNLAANCILVYYLGVYWTSIWLLFVLTPVATAVYSSRARTWAVSLIVGALLLVTHSLRGLDAPVDWAQALVQAAFIVFLGLFINRLTHFIHAENVPIA